MKVTAALAWWNERPEDLVACVEGIANIADRVVAVDGSYRRYPGATVTSPMEQFEAIRTTAERLGIECLIHLPTRLWAGQVEKRSFLLTLAAKDSDWVVSVDTDHIIYTDREPARAALAAMPDRVRFVSVDFFTPENDDRPMEKSAPTYWHVNLAGKTIELAHIFRAMSDLHVRDKHWHFYGTWKGSEVFLPYGGKADAHLPVPYVVEHRTLFHTEAQMLASRAFCNDRVMVVAQTGQEDDVPGLPPPRWDYETMPYYVPRRENPVPKPPKDQPIRVLTLSEAQHALASGYEKVFVTLREAAMQPAVMDGHVVLLSPETPAAGDITLAQVLGRWRIRRVVDVTPSGRLHVKQERSSGTHLTTRFIGKVIWSGAKQTLWKPDPEVSLRKDTPAVPKPRARRATPAPTAVAAAPKRRGRPRKTAAPA